MKLNIITPSYFGTSGYSNHSKGIANALHRIADVKLSTQLFPNWELACNDAELAMISKPDSEDRINVIIDLPFNWSQYCSKKFNVAYLIWEGDRIPKSWVPEICNERITQVWVPSIHVYEAIKKSFKDGWDLYKHKIKIIPHGVDLNIFQPKLSEKKIFTFVCNKGFRGESDRGGIQHALRAFIQEFSKEEARLIVKLNPAYTLGPEQLMLIVDKYRIEAGKSVDKMPEIFFNINNLSQTEIAKIYKEGDVFLNPTEGEAFSLCSMEAMACGLPTISTNFGGQTDFVDNSNGWLIDYELKPVQHELIYEGISWAKPNIQILRQRMRWASENRDIVLQKATKATETAKQYTWDNSALKLQEALSEIQ